jgi:hypothetical protein
MANPPGGQAASTARLNATLTAIWQYLNARLLVTGQDSDIITVTPSR